MCGRNGFIPRGSVESFPLNYGYSINLQKWNDFPIIVTFLFLLKCFKMGVTFSNLSTKRLLWCTTMTLSNKFFSVSACSGGAVSDSLYCSWIWGWGRTYSNLCSVWKCQTNLWLPSICRMLVVGGKARDSLSCLKTKQKTLALLTALFQICFWFCFTDEEILVYLLLFVILCDE